MCCDLNHILSTFYETVPTENQLIPPSPTSVDHYDIILSYFFVLELAQLLDHMGKWNLRVFVTPLLTVPIPLTTGLIVWVIAVGP